MVRQTAVYPDLENRAVVISGGSAGIGAAMVRRFAAQTARVAFLDIDENGAARTIKDAAGAGPTPLYLRCDLRNEAEIADAIDRVRQAMGPISVLVNNAARDRRASLDETTAADWDSLMAVNLRPQFLLARAVATDMIAAGTGAIVNMGSIAWMKNSAGVLAYVTAKAGIHGLTKGLARELGPHGIRVNCVAPGWVWTERQAEIWGDPRHLAVVRERQCLKEIVQPDDVAAMVLWLASDESRMCTAQTFVVDAGVM